MEKKSKSEAVRVSCVCGYGFSIPSDLTGAVRLCPKCKRKWHIIINSDGTANTQEIYV